MIRYPISLDNFKPDYVELPFEKLNKVVYITVFKSEENHFDRRDFDTLENAFNHESENPIRLVFGEFIGATDSLQNKTVFYLIDRKYIRLPQKKMPTNDLLATKSIRHNLFEIVLSDEQLQIRKIYIRNRFGDEGVTYTLKMPMDGNLRCVVSDLVPSYNSLYLQICFVYNFLYCNPTITEERSLIASLLKAKVDTDEVLKSEKKSQELKSKNDIHQGISINKFFRKISLKLKTLFK